MSVYPLAKVQVLDVAAIVRAALDLMDEIGIDALTTRGLAARLGVKGPALYWHLRNKDELLAQMCEQLLRQSLDDACGVTWRAWLRSACIALRRTLIGVRDGARLVAYAEWTVVAKTELVAYVEAPLIAAGLAKVDAMKIVGAVNSYTIGWVTTESKAGHRSFMVSQFDIDEAFIDGLDCLLAGLVARFGCADPVTVGQPVH